MVPRDKTPAMARELLSTGSPFETDLAYSRAVVQGDWCFVAGTTGYDYTTMTMPEAVLDQARNALSTISATLERAGFSLADVVRVHYYVRAAAQSSDIAPALREAFADVRPAATMLVCGMTNPEMQVEIEATALRR